MPCTSPSPQTCARQPLGATRQQNLPAQPWQRFGAAKRSKQNIPRANPNTSITRPRTCARKQDGAGRRKTQLGTKWCDGYSRFDLARRSRKVCLLQRLTPQRRGHHNRLHTLQEGVVPGAVHRCRCGDRQHERRFAPVIAADMLRTRLLR